MAAWRTGHKPGATQQQWGYARAHSFLLCGKTYPTTDSDIVKRAVKESTKESTKAKNGGRIVKFKILIYIKNAKIKKSKQEKVSD